MNLHRGYLLDTNAISELNKSRPNEFVLLFFKQLSPHEAFLSVLSLGELRKGAAMRLKRGDAAAAASLNAWIDTLEGAYADRVLPVSGPIARLWGQLSADRPRPMIDTLLAATAIHHGLTLVTRNVRDIDDTGVRVHNPWLMP